MPNSYCGLTILKSAGVLNITGTGDNARLREYLEVASRGADHYLGRRMYSYIQTRVFSGNGQKRLILAEDLVSVTTLKEDEDGNATWEATWASTDYELAPYDAAPTNGNPDFARPYEYLEINQRSNGTKSAFNKGQKRFELVGKWGWSESVRTPASLINNGAGYSATATALDVDSGADFEIAQTIIIGSEQLYITNIATNTLTVERGINGTTAAAMLDNAVITIVQHPSWLRQAVIIEAGRLYAMRTTSFASSVGLSEGGLYTPSTPGLYTRFKDLLDPHRRIAV